MARHGENIRKRKDGRWEGRYAVYNAEKQKQVYRSVYGKTYREVREKLHLHKNPSAKEHFMENCSVLFMDAAQGWLTEVKSKRKPSTYAKYRQLLHNHVEQNFSNRLLSEITDALVREQLPSHLSENTLKSIYCVLNQILKYASRQYLITMPTLSRPASKAPQKPIKALVRNEQKSLVTALCHETNLYKAAVLLCLFTGLRLGELCALKWTDIDFESRTLTVNRTVQRLYAEGYEAKTILMETAPKSAYSRREIPLSAKAMEQLIRFKSDSVYVFGGKKPMEPRKLQYHFKKILQEAKLSDTNFHILRHTFATNCIEGGTDVKSLSEMLGHCDVQITLNRYVHPSMDTKRQCMDKLSLFYGQI